MIARLAKGPLTSARGRQSVSLLLYGPGTLSTQSVSLLLYGTGTLSTLTAKRKEERGTRKHCFRAGPLSA
jgi:hypothetical protein